MTSLGKDPDKPPVMAQPEAAAQAAQAQGLEAGTQKDPTAWNTFSEMLNNYLVASGQSGQNISPDTLATLAGSGGAQGNMAGIVSAAQNFAKGYSAGQPKQEEIEMPEKQKELAEEYRKDFSDYTSGLRKYNQVVNNIKDKNTMGIALMSLAKLALPEVKTDEEAAASLASGTGILKAFQNTYNKWVKGETVGDDEIKSVLRVAKEIKRDRTIEYKERTKSIKKRAESSGIDTSNIILDPTELEISSLSDTDKKIYRIVRTGVDSQGNPISEDERKQAQKHLQDLGVDINE